MSWSEGKGRTFSTTVTIDNLLLILECFVLALPCDFLKCCLSGPPPHPYSSIMPSFKEVETSKHK